MPDPVFDFDVTLGSLAPEELHLVRFHATEAISVGCGVELWVETALEVVPADLCGKPATVRIVDADGPVRTFHGVLQDVRVRVIREGWFEFWVRMCSGLELLKLGRNHRLFRDLNAV